MSWTTEGCWNHLFTVGKTISDFIVFSVELKNCNWTRPFSDDLCLSSLQLAPVLCFCLSNLAPGSFSHRCWVISLLHAKSTTDRPTHMVTNRASRARANWAADEKDYPHNFKSQMSSFFLCGQHDVHMYLKQIFFFIFFFLYMRLLLYWFTGC